MRRLIELAYLGVAVCLIALSLHRMDDGDTPLSADGAVVARQSIDTYSSLLSRVATDAADALDSGEMTTDHELLTFLDSRRQAAADAAFESLHAHQQRRIGVEPGESFDAAAAATLMREYAAGWKR